MFNKWRQGRQERLEKELRKTEKEEGDIGERIIGENLKEDERQELLAQGGIVDASDKRRKLKKEKTLKTKREIPTSKNNTHKINLLNNKLEKEENELKKEIENLSPEDREKIGWGLNNVGFKVEQKKNKFFADVFGKIVTDSGDKQGKVARFCKGLQDSFIHDAKSAEKKAKDAREGKGGWQMKLQNPSLLAGSLVRTGRMITDVTGLSLVSPLRHVMAVSKGITRLGKAGKEARLLNEEEVITKTRIGKAEYGESDEEKKQKEIDVNRAWDEANKILERAKKTGNTSAESLKKAYLMEMPKDLQTRLKVPAVGNSFIQRKVKADIEWTISRINKSIEKIEKDPKLSLEEKEVKKEALLRRQESNLKDWDRIVTQYGTVDGWAMAGRYVETAGKALVAITTAETLVLSVEKLFEKVSYLIASHDIHPIEIGTVPGTRTWIPPLKHISEDIKATGAISDQAPVRFTSPNIQHVLNSQTAGDMSVSDAHENIAINPNAIIRKGEGIEHALRRQIEANPEWAKDHLGYKGDINDMKAIHKFSGGEAHRLALSHGYVDEKTGEEIRVKGPGNEVAYELYEENGEIKIGEMRVENETLVEEIERHGIENKFREDKIQNYEYVNSNHLKPTHPDQYHNFEKDIKIAENDEMEVENFNTEETLTPLIDTDAQTEEDIRAKIKKGYDEPWRRGIYDTKNIPEKFRTGNQSNHDAYNMEQEQSSVELSREERELYNSKFINNSFRLSEEKLMRALHAMQKDRKFIIGDEDESIWRNLRNMKANTAIKHINTPGDNPAIGRLSKYLRVLQNFTGFGPKGGLFGFRAETTEQYIARALQKLEYEGKLENFEASIRR